MTSQLHDHDWTELKAQLSTKDDAHLSISLAYTLLSQLYSISKIDDNPSSMNQVVSELDRVKTRLQMLEDSSKEKDKDIDNDDGESRKKKVRVNPSAAKRVVKHYTS
jgi:hypothetical protein